MVSLWLRGTSQSLFVARAVQEWLDNGTPLPCYHTPDVSPIVAHPQEADFLVNCDDALLHRAELERHLSGVSPNDHSEHIVEEIHRCLRVIDAAQSTNVKDLIDEEAARDFDELGM